MGLLNKIHVASFTVTDVDDAGDYPTGGSGVKLPAGAFVTGVFLEETENFANGTNIKIAAGSTDLTGVVATAAVATGSITVTGFKINAPSELKLVSTGDHAGAGGAIVHVSYFNTVDA